MTRLIVIRGNSGSGKSTVAAALQDALPDPVVLIDQDTIRRHVLAENGTDRRDYVPIAIAFTRLAYQMGYTVILEGIFPSNRCRDELVTLVAETSAIAFYLDVSFAETVRRYQNKPQDKKAGYGSTEMKKWYTNQDTLEIPGEIIFDETRSQAEIVAEILRVVCD